MWCTHCSGPGTGWGCQGDPGLMGAEAVAQELPTRETRKRCLAGVTAILGTYRTRRGVACWQGIAVWRGPEIPWEMWEKSS